MYQKVKYGYCDSDVWNIDIWFLNVMPNMQDVLRRATHGYPSELAEKAGIDPDGWNWTTEKDEAAAKEWDRILRRMAALLRNADETQCRRKNPLEEEIKGVG